MEGKPIGIDDYDVFLWICDRLGTAVRNADEAYFAQYS